MGYNMFLHGRHILTQILILVSAQTFTRFDHVQFFRTFTDFAPPGNISSLVDSCYIWHTVTLTTSASPSNTTKYWWFVSSTTPQEVWFCSICQLKKTLQEFWFDRLIKNLNIPDINKCFHTELGTKFELKISFPLEYVQYKQALSAVLTFIKTFIKIFQIVVSRYYK